MIDATETLIYLVSNPDKCDELLSVLNNIGRAYDCYENGLPVESEAQMALMREAMYRWALGIKQEADCD